MCESYARSLLRVSVAQICQALGWDAVQLTACDLLSDVLHRYIQQLARACHRYSELYGRTDPMLDDVSQAFRLLGVSLTELEDYVNNLEPVPCVHQTPLFPINKNNVLQFPQPGVCDAEERKEYIPDHMPPLVSLQEEEEEEEVPPDMGISAEAMQVALEEDEEEMDEDEAINDENHPLKRPLDSPDATMGMMPTSKRPRMYPDLSPEWGMEPREPLTSLNPQRMPPGTLPSHDSMDPLSPEMPSGTLPSFRPLPVIPKHSDPKGITAPGKKPKVSSPGRQRTKSHKGVIPVPVVGSPIQSPKPSKEKKKSPGSTKSPKSPKSPKTGSAKVSQPQSKADLVHKLPLASLSERMGKENILMRQNMEDKEFTEGPFKKLQPDNAAIEDSIDAVIARACAEKEPDPFAFFSGSDSDSNGFSSPRRLTIMEPSTPKAPSGAGILLKDTSTPLHLHPHAGLGNWTMDDSINEVIRKVNQGGPSAPPQNQAEYLSSGSASPPTPEPLLNAFEEKTKIVSVEVKKKLKKELKTKMKKKDKPKDKERDKGKLKEKSKDKSKDKNKDFSKDAKMPWKEFGMKEEELFRDFTLPEASFKMKSRDGEGMKKEKEKHKDKKKDKEKSKKDKDKKEKSKDRNKEDKQKQSALSSFGLGEFPPLFSASTCLRIPSIPSMLPSLAPILQDKDVKGKDKDKKKDKKEKKKKKDKEKDKEREKAKEKEKEKEEKRKEKEKREKEKEKERVRLEKPVLPVFSQIKMDAPPTLPTLPSPVIPRLTLRVGAGQDKIVISKVVANSEPKPPTPKTPTARPGPGNRPRSPPPPAILPSVLPFMALPASPLPPLLLPSSSLLAPPSSLLPTASQKTPVRSVVTETIRDEWGNQIWICPGCNKPDDGSPMIGCDDCDDWYHWPCVGIHTAPPEDQQWFCVKCSSKKKDKKHKKKKHKPH
ncbi:transcription initiation factor TFIID subunit 3 isoform X2 [Gouania willdenowi]|uniref:transcription initiation factor TFIID subunit 3 isoform X2 n=1 Tax=Gouania willdenowi TaxID=441366 RepID=UPI001056126F|nr:transcription initiation factor TFIID subunit 3 isoform X2 [Gouania willdenowi]